MSDKKPIAIVDFGTERGSNCEKIWAFISVDPEGNENPCGMFGPQGWVPLVTCDWSQVEKIRPVVRTMAKQLPKHRFILRQYSDIQDIETIEP